MGIVICNDVGELSSALLQFRAGWARPTESRAARDATGTQRRRLAPRPTWGSRAASSSRVVVPVFNMAR
ncbi:MAG: hypothetical protein QOD39_3538 [Mycobacterium sp.]|nr:hypothetical protein [Mycobacterium sp.]